MTIPQLPQNISAFSWSVIMFSEPQNGQKGIFVVFPLEYSIILFISDKHEAFLYSYSLFEGSSSIALS